MPHLLIRKILMRNWEFILFGLISIQILIKKLQVLKKEDAKNRARWRAGVGEIAGRVG